MNFTELIALLEATFPGAEIRLYNSDGRLTPEFTDPIPTCAVGVHHYADHKPFIFQIDDTAAAATDAAHFKEEVLTGWQHLQTKNANA